MIMEIMRRVGNEMMGDNNMNYVEFLIGAHTTLSIHFDNEGNITDLYGC